MSRKGSSLLLTMLVGVAAIAMAQAPAKTKPKKVLMPQAYLGKSETMSGPVKKDELTRLLKQGLTAHDSAGVQYKVAGFEFGYAERMLWEDSIGNLKIMVDYMNEYCEGDTLSAGVAETIYDRMKAGDTLFIRNVSVKKAIQGKGEQSIIGRGLKVYIVK